MKEIEVRRSFLRRVWELWGVIPVPFFKVSR